MTISVDDIALGVKGFSDLAEESYTLPSNWYYEPAIYRQEHDTIFYKTWWYQCHNSDLPNPGDYYVGEVADQGVLIMHYRKQLQHNPMS